ILVDADREHTESVDAESGSQRVRRQIAVVAQTPDPEARDAHRGGGGEWPRIRESLFLKRADGHDAAHRLKESAGPEGQSLVPGAGQVVRNPPDVGGLR